MVWNKTPEETVERIKTLLGDFTLRYKDIAEIVGVSLDTVYQINSKMPKEFRELRYSGINKSAKLKSNPMTGRTKDKHHNAVDKSTKSGGYLAVWKPDWWTGAGDGNRVLEHQLVWAEAHGQTEIPKGYVVHHIDHDKTNNSITNLELLSRSEHMRHHAIERHEKVQRLSRKGVGNSVPEAPSTPKG